jgi:ring-1,2-phenylacetyl-CoA epoxidase subunit PaaC
MDPLFDYALRMGDNCLILSHRVSEWCGHAPALEEDIALANVALDLIGQTQLWLGLAGEIEGKGRTADDLAFLRDVRDFRNLLLVERPNVDFAHTMVRQFLFDAWHFHTLGLLEASTDPRVAEIAAKARREVSYHLTRSSDLTIRLGDGTEISRAKMQAALDALWPYTGEMTMEDAVDEALAASGVGPALGAVKPLWEAHVAEVLRAATLKRPEGGAMQKGGKTGLHSEALGYVLADMQFLQRAYPGARW